MTKILVTGCAGFIGFHLSKLLLSSGQNVYGIDNLNKYYDVDLKKRRLAILKKYSKFKFYKIDVFNKKKLLTNFKKEKYHYVIHLAAQAGVRYSIDNPDQYVRSNLVGFYNILEGCKNTKVKHLIFSSSSSVYGMNKSFPLKENFSSDFPVSFYAATKKSNEVMGHSYSSLYKLPITVLRLFTVYGPFGRPDMSLFQFVKKIKNKKNIYLFNKGNHHRDFTYVDHVVFAIKDIIKKIPNKKIPFRVLNIGSSNPVSLKKYVKIIEKILGIKAKKKLLNLQKGDVIKTYASLKETKKIIKNYEPTTNINLGIKKFVEWYLDFYK